jgi:hypothetical protein
MRRDEQFVDRIDRFEEVRWRQLTKKRVSQAEDNQHPRTYPTLQFQRVYRRELDDLSPSIISLYT